MKTEHPHPLPLHCGVFDPTGRWFLAGGRDKSLVCLELESRNKSAIEGHETWIGAMCRAGEASVITSDFAGRLIAWATDGAQPKVKWSIEAHSNTILSMAASRDGRFVATGDREGRVRVWQASDGGRVQEFVASETPAYGVAFHADGKRLFTADREPKKPRLSAWNWETKERSWVVEAEALSGYRRVEDIEWGGIRSLAVSPDGAAVVAGGRNGYDGPASVLVFDAATGEQKRKLVSTLKNGFYYSMRFHPDGRLLTAGGDVAKGELRAWKLDADVSLKDVATAGPCTSVDVHPDGRRVAVTQMIGKSSYPESGQIVVFPWDE